jgi:hypothetical protein
MKGWLRDPGRGAPTPASVRIKELFVWLQTSEKTTKDKVNKTKRVIFGLREGLNGAKYVQLKD